MDVAKIKRVLTLSGLVFLQFCAVIRAYEIPDVHLQAFTPKGFRASIPDVPGMALFTFQGKINKPIENNDVGTLSGEILKSTNGRWVFEDRDVKLNVGDVINYYVFVSVNSGGYIRDKVNFKVEVLENWSDLPPVQPTPPVQQTGPCKPTLTRLRGGGTVCAGQTVFEDHFDTLREDVWQIEQYIPINNPEYPFVSYQRLASDPTVSVVNGNLRIAPKLQQNQPGFTNESMYSGVLYLVSGCTGGARECEFQSSGANIIPPVVSGQVTSRGLAFTYGTVHVRAKLPQGDWLYPEILLEPFVKKYGELKYASGVIKIAVARGNRELRSSSGADNGNRVLYGGPIMDFKCRNSLIDNKKLFNGKMWGDDFHLYSLNWTPDRITLLVDSEEWAYIEPSAEGLIKQLSDCPEIPRKLLEAGTKIAPFDDHFYITLGVAAAGITEFDNNVITRGNIVKPWLNEASKARFNFWKAIDSWYPTWNNPELLVDYVKVIAL